MGYVLRVRLASFFGGAAVASFLGLYILHNDYKVAHEAISQQVLLGLSYLLFSLFDVSYLGHFVESLFFAVWISELILKMGYYIISLFFLVGI